MRYEKRAKGIELALVEPTSNRRFVYTEHGTRPKDLSNGDVDDLWRLSN